MPYTTTWFKRFMFSPVALTYSWNKNTNQVSGNFPRYKYFYSALNCEFCFTKTNWPFFRFDRLLSKYLMYIALNKAKKEYSFFQSSVVLCTGCIWIVFIKTPDSLMNRISSENSNFMEIDPIPKCPGVIQNWLDFILQVGQYVLNFQ